MLSPQLVIVYLEPCISMPSFVITSSGQITILPLLSLGTIYLMCIPPTTLVEPFLCFSSCFAFSSSVNINSGIQHLPLVLLPDPNQAKGSPYPFLIAAFIISTKASSTSSLKYVAHSVFSSWECSQIILFFCSVSLFLQSLHI